jgi:hypothetical protein
MEGGEWGGGGPPLSASADAATARRQGILSRRARCRRGRAAGPAASGGGAAAWRGPAPSSPSRSWPAKAFLLATSTASRRCRACRRRPCWQPGGAHAQPERRQGTLACGCSLSHSCAP